MEHSSRLRQTGQDPLTDVAALILGKHARVHDPIFETHPYFVRGGVVCPIGSI